MSESTQSALTVGDVYRLGGWDPRYARVLALASAGGFGVSITDVNGDLRNTETELWQWDDGAWRMAKREGGHYQLKGEIRFRLKDLEVHAPYALHGADEAPTASATKVGGMSVICRPIYRGA